MPRSNRWCPIVGCLLFLTFLVYLLRYQSTYLNLSYWDYATDMPLDEKYSILVRGPPKASFRDNLQDDVKYVTAFTAGGLTNAFIAHVNLIYIAILAQRVPVLPPFTPVHVGHEPGVIQVSEVFDLEHLSQKLHIPILEWSQIKDFSAKVKDDIGCWSVQETMAGHFHLSTQAEEELRFNFSFTRVPEDAHLLKDHNDYWANYMSLAALSFPETRKRALEEARGYPPTERPWLIPEEQMMCFDLVYYTASATPFEWELEWTPAWHLVGAHLHWNQKILGITKGLVARAFGFGDASELPAHFITVHVRRSDFHLTCTGGNPNCLPPLSAYAREVDAMRRDLKSQRDIDVNHVLVLSDEQDPKWWDEVKARTWRRIDHSAERSAELYGKWFVPVIDVIAQSLGTGFVGTDHSTMSIVASRRVKDWHGGLTRLVKWDPYSSPTS